MRASAVGSVPGSDLRPWARLGLEEFAIAFIPELPDRGVHAAMIGRSLGLLDGLDADLQPSGWRIGVGSGVDHRRARSLLAQDLDVMEELAFNHEGPIKQQIAGPWTLAATVELARGDKVLADHGARRDLAESLAAGLNAHVRDLRRRFARADIIIQIDEPALPAVLGAKIPTASGFGRHRSIDLPEADAHLRLFADASDVTAVHVCAADVPVGLLHGAGFSAISFDLPLARPDDAWAEAFEAGVDLWPGSTQPARIEGFYSALGFEPESWGPRTVVTTGCGLAGRSPGEAKAALEATAAAVRSLDS